MDTSRLKKFAQYARRSLIEQVQTKLKLVLAEDSLARRESPKAVKELESKKQELGEEQLLEQVAYTWFNRFCALRFMDANQYNRIMVVSPVAGQFQPEILAEAKAGHLDDSIFNEKARDEINGLLSGSTPSRDGQSEAYRLMIVAVCNDYHRLMPYLFERIEDYTELLMPDDLLSGNSILAYTREAMTPENCESVESIGWLYQFYISEKKDQVFEGLKKNKKITPDNIPAATQLFTPHWIVRYLVENSLGRLWMLNNPNSKVIEQMDFYIKPTEEEKDYLKISSPEELKVCDPACGSGHMLTYAYDLLYAIYLDAGFDSSEIPEKILTNNLYGIEIDERAAELAAFALSMKALKGNPLDESNNRRRFFRNPVEPKICHIQNISFSDVELDEYFEFVGVDLFTRDLRATLKEFEEADNFGSLIQPTLKNPADVLAMLDSKDVSGQLFLSDTHKSVLKALKQADYLSQKYQVVVANPPYMGGKGMNPRLAKWAKDNYPISKLDLFAMFMERCPNLTLSSGYSAMINMQSWMFLSSYQKLRLKLLSKFTLTSMAHLGTRAFDSIGGEVVSTTAFVLKNSNDIEHKGHYLRLTSGRSENEKQTMMFGAINGTGTEILYINSMSRFRMIPGSPIIYWASESFMASFKNFPSLSENAKTLAGMQTGDNDLLTRRWYEVSQNKTSFQSPSSGSAVESGCKWFPYNKGGNFKKWYGNQDFLVNWENDGEYIKRKKEEDLQAGKITANNSKCWNQGNYFTPGVTWSKVSSGTPAFRYQPAGAIFDIAGVTLFPNDKENMFYFLGVMNSSYSQEVLRMLSPTLNFETSTVSKVPVRFDDTELKKQITAITKEVLPEVIHDFSSQEESWSFVTTPLLSSGSKSIFESMELYYQRSINRTELVREKEVSINKLVAESYGIISDVDINVSIDSISLYCNPYFKYGEKSIDELKSNFVFDAISDFISYSVGCIFGRYSLDKEGLILSNQGECLEEYIKQIPQPSFTPDQDNVVPLIGFEGDWFEDDIAERFKVFLKVAFGEEHFSENLKFIEAKSGKDNEKDFV
ncbi:BREX-1 system adenine-specific DNA-methyltransferase PglX, partial [Acinetobacter venetianus]|uniref:BREX-1 system adenine-specific DNA-methyltransferase PglX n=1 Tax=Acinetobacter venetianus TaxID=52133 RepID=UPI003A8FE9B6